LRRVRYAKGVVDSVPGDPHNPVSFIHDKGHRVALGSSHLPIHEEILQLFAAPEANRAEPVSRTAVPYGERTSAQVAPDEREGPIAHNCRQFAGPALGRYHAPRLAQYDLTWDRQRMVKKVRDFRRRTPAGARRSTC
jgi:hypothetical protein